VADQTITPLDPTSADTVRYELGRQNWAPASEDQHPWLPDFLHGGSGNVRLAEDQVIDLVILGDGYETATQFRSQLQGWLDDFFAVEVYERFRGAFRIRAVFTRSTEPCSTNRNTHYGVKVDSQGKIERDGWWNAGSNAGRRFRNRLFESVDRFSVNLARYPASLQVGGDHSVIHNELKGLYSNLVVMMLARSQDEEGHILGNATGMTRRVRRRTGTHLNVAFGAHSLHELGHALAYLEDEYISDRGSRASRHNPGSPSIFTLANLSFGDRLKDALWLHISPWGIAPRQAAGSEPSPLVGWLWRGGEQDKGVWHAEYQCLMNGKHPNYAYTTDRDLDPTANPPASCNRFDTEERGVDLRWRNPPRYCLWCQEIVVVRILEKTGQLAMAGDPSDVNARGRTWYARWAADGRGRYWTFFDVPLQIQEREALYASPGTEPGSFCQIQNADGSYRDLARSDLYRPFDADSREATALGPPGDDVELLMLIA